MKVKKNKKYQRFDFIRSEKGFSLAELMVAAGLVGILSLGIFQTVQNATHVSYRSSQKGRNFPNFESNKAVFQNKDKCTNTLEGLNPISGVRLNQIGRVEVSKFYGYGGGRVKILSMELKNYNKKPQLLILR